MHCNTPISTHIVHSTTTNAPIAAQLDIINKRWKNFPIYLDILRTFVMVVAIVCFHSFKFVCLFIFCIFPFARENIIGQTIKFLRNLHPEKQREEKNLQIGIHKRC